MRQKSRSMQFLRRVFVMTCVMICFFLMSASAAKLKAKLTTNKVFLYPGDTAVVSGQAKGGVEDGTYAFRFQYKAPGKKAITLKKRKSAAQAKFTPSEAGRYTIVMTVTDGEKTVTKSQIIWVKEKPSQEAMQARMRIVSIAKSWLRVKEGSLRHQQILKYYNSEQNNLYRNKGYVIGAPCTFSHYNISASEAWCDAFVSSVFIQAKMQHLSGVECACPWHITWLQHHRLFVEADDYVPFPGDIIFYCWSDSGIGDCTGISGHVGIVKSVSDAGDLVIIEGNYDDRVKYRKIKVDSRYIRGYGVPDYESLAR